MLNVLGISKIEELEIIFNSLIDVKLDITAEEIKEYSINFYANKNKLKNHTEEVSLEDIIGIYSKSLINELS
ncbi:MAG: hypothetical protein QM217_10825 [Bacillota bacterium]|jgi:alcohol dehydrogenase|nr:hypothetical protein [Bacillota bacterium]